MTAVANIKIGVSGHFTMIAHGGKRGRVVLAEFDNIIVNGGLNYAAGGSTGTIAYCQVGTGNTAAAATDAALVSRIAGTNTSPSDTMASGTYVAGSPPYIEGRRTYRFAVGAATGNLAEVGVGWATSGSLWSRALIADAGGSPTTITILSDEQLDVVYTLRVYPPSTDVTGSVTLAGLVYGYTLRASSISGSEWGRSPSNLLNGFVANFNNSATKFLAYSGNIGVVTSAPSGTNAAATASCVTASYVNNSYQRAVEYKADLNDANLAAGIKSIQFYMIIYNNTNQFGYYQAQFVAPASIATFGTNIPKDATKVLKLTLMFTLARRYP